MNVEEKLQNIQSEFTSKYYNAVSNCCFENLAKTGFEEKLTKDEYIKIIEYAHEWFMTHFFDENYI